VPPVDEVTRLTHRGLQLAQFTVAYNVAEGVLAVGIGLAAGLVSLVGFGLDSAIESISAVLVGLRLSARLRHGTADPVKERRALRGVAISFFVLSGYVVVEGGRALISGAEPESSPFGLAILGISLVVMPVLAVAKRRVGHALGGDRLILTDARQTEICIVLSLSTLAGLGLFALTGASWLDPAAGFVIAVFAIREGIEAWEGELIDLE
jgi:hypothetical protein